MKRLVQGLLLALLVATLAACASSPRLSDSQKYALYREHAGEPVRSFRYTSRINSWTPLGDQALVVWTRPSEAYLLDLSGPCQDLGFASAITISNRFGEVTSRFDQVTVHGGGTSSIRIPCRIQEIRPIDVKAIRQVERDRREAGTADRAATEAPRPGMANPAAVHCAKLGGRSIARTAADGAQSADCRLPDGQQCDEWTLYREGKCPPAAGAG
jgi:putative hemolysin